MQAEVSNQNHPRLVSTSHMAALTPHLILPGFSMSFSRNEEIFGEEEPADFVYKVVRGAVRSTRFLSDGRRQISAFHLPGDVFGLEHGDVHRFSAEALVDSEIILVRRTAITRAAERDGAVAHELWTLTADELARLQDHMLVLSRKSAAERVGTFLLKLSSRCGSADVYLPMSRGDIADHLGLTIETVSRTMTQFERESVVELPTTRRVVLKDRGALLAA